MTSARTTSVRLAAGVTVSLLALTACGGTDEGATPTTSASPSVTTPKPSATPTVSPSASTAAPPSATPTTSSAVPTTKPITVKVGIKAGVVTTASDVVDVTAGDTVTIAVKTDTADELHVHGVEEELTLTPGKRNALTFTIPTDLAPGDYEVETHTNPLLLLKLRVT